MPRPRHTAVVTVAYYTQLEALRSGLPWLAAACLLGALGLAGFLSRVAIVDAAALQLSVAGALLRACAAFLVAAHVVASVARETNDKGLELALAQPVSRVAYYVGKLSGFSLTSALLASFFALPLLLWAKPADLAAWWLCLAAETMLVAAAALFFASAMAQTVAAMAAVAGLYLLGRAMAAIQAIASAPQAGDSPAAVAARWFVDALALILPRLDAAPRSDWLLYGAPAPAELAQLLFGLGLYFLLLAAAGLFDFSRRNL
jgi:Cu-processing system permease protein